MTHSVLLRWRRSADTELRTKRINFRIDELTYNKFKVDSAKKKMTLTEWLILNGLLRLEK